MFALASESKEERQEALAEAVEILENGCLGHNYFWLHRDAMENYLKHQNWTGAGCYAAALEACTSTKALAATFYIGDARAIASLGRNPETADARTEIKRMREYPRATQLTVVLGTLDCVAANS